MRRRWPFIVTATLVVESSAWQSTARAEELHPPAEMEAQSARILIGLRGPVDAPEGNYVAWQEGLEGPGACHFARISDAGSLPDDVQVFGTEGDDYILVLPPRLIHFMPAFHTRGSALEFCGHEWQPASFASDEMAPSGKVLAVHGEGGNDQVFAGALGASLEVHGGAGDDHLVVDSAETVQGGGGNDFLIAWSMPTGSLVGGSGRDTLCWGDDHIPPWPLGFVNGGSGRDDCLTTQAEAMAGCENPLNISPTGDPSWFRARCDAPARAVRSVMDAFLATE